MDVKIEQLTQKDLHNFSLLIQIFEEVFEWENISPPSKNHLQNLLNNKTFLVFVAMQHEQIIGGLTAHILPRYDTEKPSAYIYDIAVLPNQQRKGVGKLLIAAINQYSVNNGFHEVFVQAETDDFQAVNFYKTTKFTNESKATHFTYSLDELGVNDK